MWFMTGVRKYSWHAATVCVNKSVFDETVIGSISVTKQ